MNSAGDQVTVVVPLYTSALPEEERAALAWNVRVLSQHPLTIVCPESLDLTPLKDVLAPVRPSVEHFPEACFDGVAGYNRMMLSGQFYDRFAHFRHILVCQTDAFVFKDALHDWCARNYDYIGAPWISSERNALNREFFRFNNLFRRKKKHADYLFKVGNGGFSLRKVRTMQRIVHEQRESIEQLLANPSDNDHHIEDRYFSLVAPTKLADMRIPDYHEAVAFCMDRRPQLAMRMNGGALPFACHGFNKKNVKGFWKPIIERELRRGSDDGAPPVRQAS